MQIGDQQEGTAKRQNRATQERVEARQLDEDRRDPDQQQYRKGHLRVAEEHADQLRRELFQQSHCAISIVGLRMSALPASPAPRKMAAKTSSARSCPGQSRPNPSPVQKTPNAESMTPTANFNVFSGTRDSGRCTRLPTKRTRAQAKSAPRLAGSSSPPPAPTAMTINTTSRPSSSTPAAASRQRAAAVPSAAGRQPRKVATARTIVKASTTSTSEARNAAPIAGAAVDQISIAISSYRFSSCASKTRWA